MTINDPEFHGPGLVEVINEGVNEGINEGINEPALNMP